jgi:hypothetical protein
VTSSDLKISYYLPDVTCPFSSRLNSSYGDGLVEETLSWITSLFADYPFFSAWLPYVRSSDYQRWVSMIFPDIDYATLLNWCKFTAAVTLFDDVRERTDVKEADAGDSWLGWQLLLNGLSAARSEAGSLERNRAVSLPRTIQELLTVIIKLRGTMPSGIGESFLTEIEIMARSIAAEQDIIAQRDSAIRMSLADYLDLREITIGLRPYTASMQVTGAESLTAGEREDRRMARLRWLAHVHMALTDDLYSFRKEYVHNPDRVSSLVHPLPIQVFGQGKTWQQAVDRVIGQIKETEQEFCRIQAAWIADGAAPAVREMCQRLEWAMAGTLHYVKTSPRYHGPGAASGYQGQVVVCDPADIVLFGALPSLGGGPSSAR